MWEDNKWPLLPKPPVDAVFSLLRVEKITTPHPYCLGPKHVGVASDHHCGLLGVEAIQDAERRGAHCMTGKCRLAYDKHVTSSALFIEVPQNRDLNAVPGLHDYLLAHKAEFEVLGIDGFAFPTK